VFYLHVQLRSLRQKCDLLAAENDRMQRSLEGAQLEQSECCDTCQSTLFPLVATSAVHAMTKTPCVQQNFEGPS
jgi:hypothetical protein